jgi:hypothetical protein
MLFALAGCDEKAQPQVAPPPAPVTQPVKRTVTDWVEFTGRFEAIQEVQVRARVGGFVNGVEFKDGAIVHSGDLLYIIDPRPFEAVTLQAEGQLADARAKVELAKRDLERGLELVQTSAVSEQAVDQRRQALQAALAMKYPAELYSASPRHYDRLPDLTYPFHDRDILVTACGRICLQRLGIKEVDDGIWLVSFSRYDLGYFDLERKTLQPLDNPFGPRLSPMS